MVWILGQLLGAWIVTAGTHCGVMRLVGEAVIEYAFTKGKRLKIPAIAITPWGCIHKKEQLESKVTQMLRKNIGKKYILECYSH